MHRRGLLAGMAGAAIWVALASGCAGPSPEQALRSRMDQLQSAIDARDAGAVEDVLADDFVGNAGMDRPGARRLAAAMFLRYREVGVRFGPVEVELRGERATARFTVVATGGSGGLLPENGQVYDVTTGWRRDGDDWRITSADWEPKL